MRSTAPVPTQSPRSLEPFTYSSTVLPRGSLGAFLTNITLWNRENGPPQGGTPRPSLPARYHSEGGSRQSSGSSQEGLLWSQGE